ncbi:hypothetical protein IMSHALPRED_010991 [Imshaugia aleurites]|uniref:Uncharacterized protein n=1 Tax=Imshaugia aleurites TaxID=172621 RepID=A0A8H3G2U2_9LECA|nr:hypothetical protein IMSHALPRED_010991 [Imshaugia aleurites]
MAQPPPPPPPPSAGQQLLEFILNRNHPEITHLLLQNLNLFDYMNLRTRLNSHILHSVDPIQLLNQTRAPWVAPPAPPTVAATANTSTVGTADYLWKSLGAHCDDNRFTPGVPFAQRNLPCTNGPMTMARMEACKHANPTGIPPGNPPPHAPFPTESFNVCDPCVRSWRVYTQREVSMRIPGRRLILCKSHSLRLRRRDQIARIPGCTCMRDINAGHKCSGCRLDTELTTYRVGDDRRDALLRTHISYTEEGRKGRKTLVVRPDVFKNGRYVNRRTRPACPEAGCGKKPWIRHSTHPPQGPNEPEASKHADAGLMCLCCNQRII